MSVKGFKLSDGTVVKYDYSSLDNIITDSTLSVDGVAADAGAVGDELTDIKQDLQNAGMSDELKLALYDCISHIGAWTDEHGQEYVDALYDALFPVTPPSTLTSITCVYTQSGNIYVTNSLDDLKSDLVVTAHYSDGSSNTVTTYTLSGTLAIGTSTISVAYNGKTTTFDVTVSAKYSYSINDVIAVKGAIASNDTVGGHYNTNSTYSKNRRTFMLDYGDIAMPHYTDASRPEPGEYYPIPIPSDAVKVTVSIEANTQYLSLSTWNLDENNHYIRDTSGAWEQGTSVATFTAGEFTYLTVLAKVNSAGGNYSDNTEPTGISILFE